MTADMISLWLRFINSMINGPSPLSLYLEADTGLRFQMDKYLFLNMDGTMPGAGMMILEEKNGKPPEAI